MSEVGRVAGGIAALRRSTAWLHELALAQYVLIGSLFSFMTSLQEASAVLFLSLGGWETIPVGIFAFYIAGSANEAAALGVILIAVAALTVLIINRIAGARLGGMFG